MCWRSYEIFCLTTGGSGKSSICEEIGLRAQTFIAGAKLGMKQLQNLLVHGLAGGAVLPMQPDQKPLQN